MGRRKKRHPRCPECRLHIEDCFCDDIRPVGTMTRLVLVIHRRELKRPTNTGRLALSCLTNTAMFVRGEPNAPLDLSTLDDPTRRTLLLHPRRCARTLTSALCAEDDRPVTLVVPDGSWAQARRVVAREPILTAALAVTLPPGPPTRYRLRTEHVPAGLATAEAIARAFGILEGREVQSEIERIFDLMVQRSIARQ